MAVPVKGVDTGKVQLRMGDPRAKAKVAEQSELRSEGHQLYQTPDHHYYLSGGRIEGVRLGSSQIRVSEEQSDTEALNARRADGQEHEEPAVEPSRYERVL